MMTDIEFQVDSILAEIGANTADLNRIAQQMEAQMASVRAAYTLPLAKAQERIAMLEANLENLVLEHRKEVMKGKDRANLANGSVLLKTEKRVKRIRDMLQRLEAARRTELIKIAKAVDWDEVEKLDDADLKSLGTKKVDKDRFSYELRQ